MLNPGQEPDHVRGNTSQHVESEAQFDVECPHEISNWSLDLKHLKRSLVVPLQQIFATQLLQTPKPVCKMEMLCSFVWSSHCGLEAIILRLSDDLFTMLHCTENAYPEFSIRPNRFHVVLCQGTHQKPSNGHEIHSPPLQPGFQTLRNESSPEDRLGSARDQQNRDMKTDELDIVKKLTIENRDVMAIK
jgi:hypothetical protein